MSVETTEEPDALLQVRAEMRITNRQGRLILNGFRADDEVIDANYFLLPARAGDAVRVPEKRKSKASEKGTLPAAFSLLETMLGMEIPAAVKKLRLTEPLFCLRLYYLDTHSPREDYGLRVRLLTEPLRRQLIFEASSPANLSYALWNPLSGAANGTPGQTPGLYEVDLLASKSLGKHFATIYDLLRESEDEYMSLLQELSRRVCKKLNAINWNAYTATTDDFVAFPADGSGFFGGEYEMI